MALYFYQNSFQLRNDDGSESAATNRADRDTNLNFHDTNNFRVRCTVLQDSVDDDWSYGINFDLYYSTNGGSSWSAVGTTTPVQFSLSSNFTDGAATTQQDPIFNFLAFAAGQIKEATGSITVYGFEAGGSNGGGTELEWCLKFDSAQVADAAEIQLRVQMGATPLDYYSTTPSIRYTLLNRDAISSATANASSVSATHVVASQSNRLLLVAASALGGNQATAATYNGVSMTEIGTAQDDGNGIYTSLWGLLAPATGSHTVQVTFGGSAKHIITAQSFFGVDQTLPANNAQNNFHAYDLSATVTSVAAGGFALMVWGGKNNNLQAQYNDATTLNSVNTNNPFAYRHAVMYKWGSGSVTIGCYTGGVTEYYAYKSVAVTPYGLAAASTGNFFSLFRKASTLIDELLAQIKRGSRRPRLEAAAGL